MSLQEWVEMHSRELQKKEKAKVGDKGESAETSRLAEERPEASRLADERPEESRLVEERPEEGILSTREGSGPAERIEEAVE